MKTLITRNVILLVWIYFQFISLALANNYISENSVYWKSDTAKVELKSTQPEAYRLTTTSQLRDNIPWNKERTVTKTNQYPMVHSDSLLFDALYALSIEELKENSVEQITDHSFSTSDCHCFETGRKWNYVWTRDISYSAHLGLAALNQKRTLESLLFKVSKRRGQADNSIEVVQDTGTGGSWPISTDRVVWSIAAKELLKYLTVKERAQFVKTAYTALKNTVDNDRVAVYDESDGLYSGEQSFLDWREQTYPHWVSENVVHVGMSKALSTNVTHYTALQTTADLALELGKVEEFKYYTTLATELRSAINRNFWDADKGLYSTFVLTYLNRAKMGKYDLLGNALAVIFDVAQTKEQKEAIANYPMVSAGAPVVWPQDPTAPIYHNRGIWPFVTEYGLLAAKKSKQAKVYNHLFDSMVRGTALNLSNMENFEFLSMQNWVDDGILTGPVVNSQRQLWSVAGMLSTYLDGVFGKEVEGSKIRFNPFITDKIRNTVLKSSQKLVLENFNFRNKKITVEINLPVSKLKWNEYNYYKISEINFNGTKIAADKFIDVTELNATNKITINLKGIKYSNERVKIYQINSPYGLSQSNYEALYSPRTPTLYPIKDSNGSPHLHFETDTFETVAFNIYRNGKLIAHNIYGTDYIDTTSDNIQSPCYSVETIFKSSGNASHHSEPHCFWRQRSITQIPVTHPSVNSQGTLNYYSDHGKIFLKKWGNKNDKLEFNSHKVHADGTYALQLVYNNLGHINTGITSAVKRVKVIEDKTGAVVADKVFMMPHHNRSRYWIDSNFIPVKLKAGVSYSIVLSDFYNMSYFEHFNTYLYRGGRNGAYNFMNLAELKLLRVE